MLGSPAPLVVLSTLMRTLPPRIDCGELQRLRLVFCLVEHIASGVGVDSGVEYPVVEAVGNVN